MPLSDARDSGRTVGSALGAHFNLRNDNSVRVFIGESR